MSGLEKEFDYYLKKQKELVKEYEGKYIVIKDQKVVYVSDTELDAYEHASKEFKPGSFLIQPVTPGAENYTQTFFSRVTIK